MKIKVTGPTTAMVESSSQKEQDGSPVWYQVNVDAPSCTCPAGTFGKPCKHVPACQEAIKVRYSEAWQIFQDKEIRYISVEKGVHTLVILECSQCKGEAVFTEEGPNDEYPQILCGRCESA